MEVRLTVTVEPDFVVLLLRYLGGVDQRPKKGSTGTNHSGCVRQFTNYGLKLPLGG